MKIKTHEDQEHGCKYSKMSKTSSNTIFTHRSLTAARSGRSTMDIEEAFQYTRKQIQPDTSERLTALCAAGWMDRFAYPMPHLKPLGRREYDNVR